MKLFTKEIDRKLFNEYNKYAADPSLESQIAIAKIFNPYGRGNWYILNSDENDPDYLWAIVDLFEVEIGSVSRSELETLKVPPFGLGLERDLYFTPINAKELYEGLLAGKTYEKGGTVSTDENKEMLSNLAVQLNHHSKELMSLLPDAKDVEPWVVAKAQRSATDLSDITHYLEGNEKMAYEDGGIMADGGETDDYAIAKSNAFDKVDWENELKEYAGENYDSLTKREREQIISDIQKDWSRSTFFENGGELSKDESLKHFILNFASSGSVANKIPYDTYKDIDGVRNKSIEILNRDGDRKYSIEEFNNIIQEALLEYDADKRKLPDGGYMAAGGIIAYSDMNYENKLAVFNSLETAKKFAKSNKWKYENITFEDEKGDTIIVSKDDSFKDIDWLFSGLMADGGYMAKGGELSKDLQIQKLLGKKSNLEDKLWDARVKENERFNRIGWGSGMRLSKINVSFRTSNSLRERISNIENELEKLGYTIKHEGGGYMAKGGATGDYEQFEMIVFFKELEKDGGKVFKDRFLVSARNTSEAKDIAIRLWKDEYSDESDLSIVDVLTDAEYRMKGKSKHEDGGMMAKGGVTFQDKVNAISSRLVNTKVPSKYKKDYGAKYDKQEAILAAKKIAGSMAKKMS